MTEDATDAGRPQVEPNLSVGAAKEKRQFAIAIGLCIIAGIAATMTDAPRWFKLFIGSLVALGVVLAVIGAASLFRKQPPG